jgi:hypothetical protein
MWQVTTVIWGAAFLLDAAVRVVMAYAVPVSDVPALAGALWLVTFLLLQIITNVYLSRSGLWPILRGHQPAVPPDPSERHTTGTGPARTAGPQNIRTQTAGVAGLAVPPGPLPREPHGHRLDHLTAI